MKLVERMPRVCKAVIKANGGYVKNLKYKMYFDLFNTFFGSSCRVFVIRGVGEWMIAECVFPTTKRGGVMVWGCFVGDTVCDLFRIEGTHNQYAYHSILQRYTIPPGLRLVGLSLFLNRNMT